MISTYPPTQCGIATFARSLTEGLDSQGAEVGVARLVDKPQLRPSDVVVHQHIAGVPPFATTTILNSYDVVIVQHEFGIFDGHDGDEVLGIMAGLRVPIILVTHTVISNPRLHQRYVFQHALDLASSVVTMTEAGRRALIRNYQIEPRKVRVIPHGSADLRSSNSRGAADDAPVVLTWGLLGRGKGIEWGIDAMRMLQDDGISARYVIAGQTHPKVKSSEGEAYRESLRNRATALGVADKVEFIDSYLDSHSLASVIKEATVLMLPYDSRDQVTSGVLIEAMVTGKPVISTRFPHAVELLGDGTGELVDQADASGLAQALARVLTDEAHAESMRTLAQGKAERFLWPSVARDYLLLSEALVSDSGLRMSQRLVGVSELAVS